jgi:30S ribosomal protein S31
MGKGDIKTKRGKIFNGTFGVSRPHKVKAVPVAASKNKKSATKKKASK